MTASKTDQPLTQEELLVGKPNSRVFVLEKDDPRNPARKALQFFSTYDPIRVGGALPITLHKGVWHQISKEFTIANAAPTIHDYDEQSDASRGKEKSLPDAEDNIEESLQKAINLSIRETPFPPSADIRPHGTPLATFHGDRALADNFLDELKIYFRLNWAVPTYQSHITRATFALTYIKGKQVAGWVQDFGEFLDTLDPLYDDGPIVWEHFLDSFKERFQDSTKENRARNDLKKLQLRLPLIDEYTSRFEELARQAGYQAGNPKTRQLFLHGLPRQVLEEVMRGGMPLTYQDLKPKAVEVVHAHQTIDNIVRWRDPLPQNPFSNNRQNRPFY